MTYSLNTNVQHRGELFHFQTEFWKARSLFITQVFLKGQVVEKVLIPLKELPLSNEKTKPSSQDMTKALKTQHQTLLRLFLENKMNCS